MRDSIARALTWVRLLLTPRAPGRHRACPAASTPRIPEAAPVPTPTRGHSLRTSRVFHDPLFDDTLDMVRPYVLLHEQRRERERQERPALSTQLDGINACFRSMHGAGATR